MRLRLRGQEPDGFADEAVAAEAVRHQADLARLHLRQIEQIVDERQEEPARAQDVRDVFVVFGRAQRSKETPLNDFGKADDGIEWRTKLVAHIGEK